MYRSIRQVDVPPVAEVVKGEVGHMTHVKSRNFFFLLVFLLKKLRKYNKIGLLTHLKYMFTLKLTPINILAGSTTVYHCRSSPVSFESKNLSHGGFLELFIYSYNKHMLLMMGHLIIWITSSVVHFGKENFIGISIRMISSTERVSA